MPETDDQRANPRGPHVMSMRWSDLLFAHWPVEPDVMRARLPAGLEPDLFEGQAWIAVVPFLMSRVRPAFLPPIPGCSRFPELNLRTYVRPAGPVAAADARSGVFFFSLDAADPIAVRMARTFFHLPYVDADMRIEGDGTRRSFESRRTDRTRPPAAVTATWTIDGPAREAEPGTFAEWSTDRMRLFSVDGRGRVHRGEIRHVPWRLAPATAELDADDLFVASGFETPGGPPRLLAADPIDVRAWMIRRVKAGPGAAVHRDAPASVPSETLA